MLNHTVVRSLLCLALLSAALPGIAQVKQQGADMSQTPRAVTYCDLTKNPAAYNHQTLRLTAFVTHGFEEFMLAEPDCALPPQYSGIWVTYGGAVKTNTAYCCPGESGDQTRSSTLSVEGITLPLIDDSVFQSFTSLLIKERDTTLRARLVGTFFSGEKRLVKGVDSWSGFGHMGCCSLFVIQQVEWFEPHTRADLDYSAEVGWYEKEGCNYKSMTDLQHISISEPDRMIKQAIQKQSVADKGQTWRFTNPERVAIESLAAYSHSVNTLQVVRKSARRVVYRSRKGRTLITVVVVRPYWLSTYASTTSVAWITTTIKEAECR